MYIPFRKWPSRHRNRTNFMLHMVGIPATIVAVPLAVLSHWLLAGGMFMAGYALQLIGHVVEGNRSGEERVIRKLLGLR